MEFEWDEDKADINKKKHGVKFDEAMQVFFDPYRLERYDDSHDDEEERWRTIGVSKAALLMVVYTERGITGEIIRLISARKANRYEQEAYSENFRRSR